MEVLPSSSLFDFYVAISLSSANFHIKLLQMQTGKEEKEEPGKGQEQDEPARKEGGAGCGPSVAAKSLLSACRWTKNVSKRPIRLYPLSSSRSSAQIGQSCKCLDCAYRLREMEHHLQHKQVGY